MRSRTVMLWLVASIAAGLGAPANAQVFAPIARVEVAEVRAVDAVPGNVAQAFETATPGPSFPKSAKAIFVHFQASTPPKVDGLSIVWVAVPDGGAAPSTVQRTPLETAALANGVLDVLTSGGKVIAPGRYIVSLEGPDARVVRAVEFRVGEAPPIRNALAPPPQLVRYDLDEFRIVYPSTYSPQPIEIGMRGVVLRRTAPYGLMLAVLSEPGTDTVLPQARELVQIMLTRFGQGTPSVKDVAAADIPADQLPVGMIAGKAIGVVLARGLNAQANLYSRDVGGRRILFGYLTITGSEVDPENQHLLTTDPTQVYEDFLAMAASCTVVKP